MVKEGRRRVRMIYIMSRREGGELEKYIEWLRREEAEWEKYIEWLRREGGKGQSGSNL